ncbi:hypothetical protein GOODEAATRI_012601 [Goodea atripinnis]|uniref:Uncharacterized protein n=1 Tax=Goodea atripinnis TaxID=208336 RepID=A0ABV0P3L5_9TELE
MANSGGAQQGATILQYAQTPDGQQILVPSNQVVVQGAGGEVQTYQIRTAPTSASLPQTVVMTSPVGLSQTKTDDPTLKREIRLAKNRYISVTIRERRSRVRRRKSAFIRWQNTSAAACGRPLNSTRVYFCWMLKHGQKRQPVNVDGRKRNMLNVWKTVLLFWRTKTRH